MASPGEAGRQVGMGTWWFDGQGELVGYNWAAVPLMSDITDDIELARWMKDNP
jgi:hypothetical protein